MAADAPVPSPSSDRRRIGATTRSGSRVGPASSRACASSLRFSAGSDTYRGVEVARAFGVFRGRVDGRAHVEFVAPVVAQGDVSLRRRLRVERSWAGRRSGSRASRSPRHRAVWSSLVRRARYSLKVFLLQLRVSVPLNPADAHAPWHMVLSRNESLADPVADPTAMRVESVLERRQHEAFGGGYQRIAALIDRDLGDGRVAHQPTGSASERYVTFCANLRMVMLSAADPVVWGDV